MKTMWLNTIPHTGTHTLLYLFSQLGRLDVLWDHFEARRKGTERGNWMVEHAKEHRGEIVFVQSYRSYESLRKSYDDRKPGTPVLDDNIAMRQKMMDDGYPCDFIIPIRGTAKEKTHVAIDIFKACGVDTIPPAAIEFMKTWPRLHEGQGAGAPHRGFPDKAVWTAFKPLLSQRMTKWMDE